MLKTLLILSVLVVCCYCEQNNTLLEEARAKKKKGVARLWIMLAILIFSKVAVFKVASVFLFMAFFQKFFYIIGLVISYFMKNKAMKPPAPPAPLYGPPADYNTVGYSYGPPENEPFTNADHAGSGYPDLANFNWPFNKKHV